MASREVCAERAIVSAFCSHLAASREPHRRAHAVLTLLNA